MKIQVKSYDELIEDGLDEVSANVWADRIIEDAVLIEEGSWKGCYEFDSYEGGLLFASEVVVLEE